jgi:hypothetical protein
MPYIASRKSLEAESFGGKKSYWHVEEAAESTKKPASEAEHQNFSESTIMRWWHKAILCCSPLAILVDLFSLLFALDPAAPADFL